MIRQGDILLIPAEKIPFGLTQKNNILAYGEVTGHSHKLVGKAMVWVDTKGNQYVQAEQDCSLEHEEHETLQVEKGQYQVIIQREYSVLEGVRQVSD